VSGIALLLLAQGCRATDAPRGVVLVILDTVRADHLSSYGYERETTPNLDRLAAEGERYEQAWAQAPWTLPAIATILTGQPPHVHGANRTARGLFPLREEIPTLAQLLAEREFRTAAFINVVWCSPRSELDRGFAVYDYAASDASNRGQRDARETTDAVVGWLAGLQPDDDFLLVVHYFDAHLTYDPPQPFDTLFEPDEAGRIGPGFGAAQEVFAIRDGRLPLDERQRASLVARYDGEIRFADEQFGRLRAELERLGRWDDSLVVAVGDHGEEFWDHGGFEHGHSHHVELLRVPLIVKRPDGPAGAVLRQRVRQLDIVPTVLEYTGIENPGGLPGRPLGREGARYSVAEGSLWAGDLVSVRSDLGTLIRNRTSGATLFFGPDDPGELRPGTALVGPAAALAEILGALPPDSEPGARPYQPSEEQLERLRALGYVR